MCGGLMAKKYGTNLGANARMGYYYKCTECGWNYVPES